MFSGDECHVTIGFCTPSFVAKWNQLGQLTIFCVFASRNFVWPSWVTFVSFSSPLYLLYPLLCQKMLKLQQNILNINKAELYFRGATD
jgi:hypothetical protein